MFCSTCYNIFLPLFVNCYSHSLSVGMSSKAALSGLTAAVRAAETSQVVLHKDCNTLEWYLSCWSINCKILNEFYNMLYILHLNKDALLS